MTMPIDSSGRIYRLKAWGKSLLCWNALWLLLLFGFFAFFFIASPATSDDWWFKSQLRPWFEAQGLRDPSDGGNTFRNGIPWDIIVETWQYHFRIDNVRLGNIIVVILMILPRWIGTSISALSFIAVVMCGFRIAHVDWRKSAWIPLAVLLWTFMFPIQDRFTSVVFQVNYVWGSGLAMLFAMLLLKESKKRKDICLLAFLGFVTGMWNEGFGVPLLGCVCALIVFLPRWRTRGNLLIALMLLSAFFVLLTSGGKLAVKLSGGREIIADAFAERWKYLLVYSSYWVAAAAGAIIAAARRHQVVKMVSSPLFIVNCVAGLVCTVIMMFSFIQWRVGCCSLILTTAFVIYVLCYFYPLKWGAKGRGKYVFGILCLSVSFVHLTFVDAELWKYRKVWHKAITQFTSDPHSVLWGDIVSPTRSPWICWVRPDIMFFTHSQSWATEYYLHPLGGDPGWSRNTAFAVIPESLKDFTLSKGRKLGGDGGYYEYEGWLVRAALPDEPKGLYVDVLVSAAGKTQNRLCYRVKFRSQADGRYYMVVLQTSNWFHFRIHPVESVSGEEYHGW